MGWLTKILRGTSHRISKGQYHGKYEDDAIWEGPTTSVDQLWDFDKEELERAIALSKEENEKGKKVVVDDDDDDDDDDDSRLQEDEQLAKAIQESWNLGSPPRPPPSPSPSPPLPRSPKYDYGGFVPPNPFHYPSSGYSFPCPKIGRTINLAIKTCITPNAMFANTLSPRTGLGLLSTEHILSGIKNIVLRTNMMGHLAVAAVNGWRYLILDDGRKLCLECLDSSIMDTHECQPLYLEIQEFYEGLNMKVEQQVPLLLVERQALNEAMEGEKNGHHHMPETRGLCLSEEQTVSTILRRPRIGGYRIVDMFTEPYKLVRKCEVTAILILYGLPRLLTGSILAHEMMHAWLRLKGYPNLSPEIEEGICQVLAHLWLDSEIVAGSGSSNVASSSSSSSSSTSSSSSSKKGKRSEFEKKLGEFFKHQIESDTSAAYGDGFREGNKAVLKYGLKRTLDHIRLTGSFPC
ncbi:protein da1-related 1 [Phtheirospermum japonicum]|uniref:Protein da1-related 1 n=1 Tax=Phtheirospermum japonicum TaxID=374723 RepID=A0A830B5K7_9LAMI|nr:protein da1-related 1 [Phtheirospermum japonicum]